MKIVIDISDDLKARLDEGKVVNGGLLSKRILYAVLRGTPLPKGYGRLIDADALWDEYHANDYDFYEALDLVPTIIPADTESEVEE